MKVSQFILYGPVEGEYHVFVNGTYYIAKTRHGQVEVDDWTKQPKMIPKNYHRYLLQPSSSIVQKGHAISRAKQPRQSIVLPCH